jgi:hypothetical protein
LFDLPEVIAQAKARPNPRITYVGGDFFKDKVPACDLYVMMTVIHDWSDAESIAIFKNLRSNAPPSAKLLLVEAIVDETATDNFPIDMDIEMLAFVHGRERTQSQWQSLLAKSGFKLARATPLGGLSGLVEAVAV